MGTIVRARDEVAGGLVAVKLLQPQEDPRELLRFVREAQLLAEIHHPHVVSYVAHGIGEEGQPYLVMEWLEGEDLQRHLHRRLPGVAESVALLSGVSAALAEAHLRGIVHRDLKPSNLFLRGGDPRAVVLLDFGLARQALRMSGLTRTGVIVGTPEYMAPEQVRGEQDIGFSADIFSLGCLAFECLTGQPPFSGDHLTAVLVKVLFEEPPALHTLRPDVPRELSELVARMLQKDPKDRFTCGLELNRAVRRLDLTRSSTPGSGASWPSRLSPNEQQFLAVAVARHPSFCLQVATDDPLVALSDALREFGVHIERLANDRLVATALPSGSAADQVLLASRCGLVIKRLCPVAEVAVASGLGRMRGRLPGGEVMDRATALLATGELGAPPPISGVWLDSRTCELLSGRLDVVRLHGRIQLVGAQPFTLRDGEMHLLGLPAPFLGREQELGTIESVLAACVGDSIARAVGVVAPPGLGKSRLRHEFLRGAQAHHPSLVVMLGRGDPMRAGAPYAILGEAVRGLCGLLGGEPARDKDEQRLRERLGLHLAGDPDDILRTVDFLCELCGVRAAGAGHRALHLARTNPKVMHEQITHAFLVWMRGECRAAPVLLVLEDLHWGDALTVQLIAHMLHELADLPLMVLALARPAVQESFPAFWNRSVLQVMPLRELSRRAAERLSHEVLRQARGVNAEPATVARIVEQGAGHPLLLEELLRAEVEGHGDAIPETVLAMLLARLSQLDARARQTLCAASVYGDCFTRAGVVALLADEAADDLDISLQVLLRAECIEYQRNVGDVGELGGERYRFRHVLMRDAAYSLLTGENRVAAHRLACGYLEGRGDVEPALLAEHAERGLDPQQAAHWGLAAARQAFASCDPDLAHQRAARALAGAVSDEQRGILLAIRAWSYQVRMDLAAAHEDALAALAVLRAGSYWWTKSINACFLWSFITGRFERLKRMFEAFLDATPDADARLAFLEAGSAICVSFANLGERRAATQTIDKMREVAGTLDRKDHGFLLLADSYRLLKLEPDLHAAIRQAEAAYGLVAGNGEGYIQRAALFYLGVARAAGGAVAEGEQLLRKASAIARRLKEDFGAVIIHLHLGLVLAGQPDPDKQAEAQQISAAYVERKQFGPAMLGLCHQIIGRTRMIAGDLAGAEEALHTAMTVFGPLLPARLLVVALLVEVLLRQDRAGEARTLAEEALRRVDEHGGLGQCELPLRLSVSLARLAEGDIAAAHDAIEAAKAQVHRRAALIDDPALRSCFLHAPDHARILALGSAVTLSAALAHQDQPQEHEQSAQHVDHDQ